MAGPMRVLALDGGGIREYLPALILADLERRAGKPVGALLNLIVGTSTGGVIGLGIASGIAISTSADFYPTYGPGILGQAGKPDWEKRVFGPGANLVDSFMKAGRSIGVLTGGNPSCKETPYYQGNARHDPTQLERARGEVLGTSDSARRR